MRAGHRLARDHQNGVIPGDGADHLGQRGAVDGTGQVVGRTRWGAQDGQVGTGVSGYQQLTEQPRYPLGAAGDAAHRAAVLGHDVHPAAAVGAAQFHRSEFLKIPRQGGLGDVDPVIGQQCGEFALAVHRPRRQDRDDPGLTAGPGGGDFR